MHNRPHSEESRRKMSEAKLGKRHGKIAAGRWLHPAGHVVLSMQYDHPLARRGQIEEHRKVLYDEIGPGPHECYWNSVSGCGKTQLEWNGRAGIHVDHLDANKQNNDPANLVPSCRTDNRRRAAAGNPIDWRPRERV